MDERIRFEGTREAPARTASVGVLLATGLPGAAQRPLAVVECRSSSAARTTAR